MKRRRLAGEYHAEFEVVFPDDGVEEIDYTSLIAALGGSYKLSPRGKDETVDVEVWLRETDIEVTEDELVEEKNR